MGLTLELWAIQYTRQGAMTTISIAVSEATVRGASRSHFRLICSSYCPPGFQLLAARCNHIRSVCMPSFNASGLHGRVRHDFSVPSKGSSKDI